MTNDQGKGSAAKQAPRRMLQIARLRPHPVWRLSYLLGITRLASRRPWSRLKRKIPWSSNQTYQASCIRRPHQGPPEAPQRAAFSSFCLIVLGPAASQTCSKYLETLKTDGPGRGVGGSRSLMSTSKVTQQGAPPRNLVSRYSYRAQCHPCSPPPAKLTTACRPTTQVEGTSLRLALHKQHCIVRC